MIDRPCRTRTREVNVVGSDRLDQHGENNKSNRRQGEFIPSRLEKSGLGIMCVKINNDELFCNAFRLKMHSL